VKHVSVKSSHLESVGYDSGTQKMHVRFKNGDVHEFDVPEHVHAGLVNSDSPGSYFHKFIKPLNGRRIQ
jgi:hypothetical protein